eukprot:10806520-Alexandrium_andersonii.AAC.1
MQGDPLTHHLPPPLQGGPPLQEWPSTLWRHLGGWAGSVLPCAGDSIQHTADAFQVQVGIGRLLFRGFPPSARDHFKDISVIRMVARRGTLLSFLVPSCTSGGGGFWPPPPLESPRLNGASGARRRRQSGGLGFWPLLDEFLILVGLPRDLPRSPSLPLSLSLSERVSALCHARGVSPRWRGRIAVRPSCERC